jgi:hypothetical protein
MACSNQEKGKKENGKIDSKFSQGVICYKPPPLLFLFFLSFLLSFFFP